MICKYSSFVFRRGKRDIQNRMGPKGFSVIYAVIHVLVYCLDLPIIIFIIIAMVRQFFFVLWLVPNGIVEWIQNFHLWEDLCISKFIMLKIVKDINVGLGRDLYHRWTQVAALTKFFGSRRTTVNNYYPP